MAIEKIKYSSTSDAPLSLFDGELAYSSLSNKLYIGAGGTNAVVELYGPGVAPFEGDQLVDLVSDTKLYRGEAVTGSSQSASVWRIREVVSAVDGSSATTKWASGTETFDKIWNNRANYSYS